MTPALWPTALAAFLASLVEFVEALTIVLAVGAMRGWRAAWVGTVAAVLLLVVLILVFGPKLASLNVPLFQIVVGTLLLLFGLRWLKKAMLRAGGALALHDEAQAFAEETATLRSSAARPDAASDVAVRLDFGAAATAFNGVFVEGVEVIFIVLAVGAAGGAMKLAAATLGAAAAAILVVALGFAARRPLTQVPENALKLMVGALVSAFGTFWVGEGLGMTWPGGDWAAVLLSLGYLGTAWIGTSVVRRTMGQAT